jgi:dolichyl-phosphate beta-glucosyltransferase
MRAQLELSIVIPAYNEEGRLAPTVRDTVAHLRATDRRGEVIVVDDGSLDGTSALVHRLGEELPEVRLIRLAANRGKGYAVRTGVLNARGDLILFADADGATPITELARLEAALAGGADVAIGSRALAASDVRVRARVYRRLMGRLFHQLVRLLTVRGIADTQCGFKLFRGAVAQDLFSRMRMNGFVFDVEVLLMAQRRGYGIAEVPVNWVHQPGSRVNLVLDSLRMARDLFLIRARVMRGDYERPHVAALTDSVSRAASATAPVAPAAPRR